MSLIKSPAIKPSSRRRRGMTNVTSVAPAQSPPAIGAIGSPLVTPTQPVIVTRYKAPGDASTELFTTFNVWTGKLSAYGPQIAFALIAANWAIHGTRTEMLANSWAQLSLLVSVTYLALLLPAMLLSIRLLRKQIEYADVDRARWEREAADNASLPIGKKSHWPYTNEIYKLSIALHHCHVWSAFVSGSFLALSLFFGNAPAKRKADESHVVNSVGSVGLQRIGQVDGFLIGDATKVLGGDNAMKTAIQNAATSWIRNRSQGKTGVLVIVGATDRLRLNASQMGRFDANIGLAQARAEEVEQRLLDVLNKQAPKLAPRSDEILVLGSGPNHVPLPQRCASCADIVGFPEDRSVNIWALWVSSSYGGGTIASSH